MAEKYLLEVSETESSEHEHITLHLIEAADRQMVKYHFHRTLKDMGYCDTRYGKHCLEGYRGLHADIARISKLSPIEYEVMDNYLPHWTKI